MCAMLGWPDLAAVQNDVTDEIHGGWGGGNQGMRLIGL